MKNGGYQIIDFTGITAWDGSETVPGAYAKVKGCSKPILASNVNGINAFTSDANPLGTDAVIPAIAYSGGSLSLIAVKIGTDDSVEIIS